MSDFQVGAPQPITPHNQALYEAGKQMLVESIAVGRDFCKFMVGVSTGAIPLYLALLAFALPSDYRPDLWKGAVAIVPAALFLLSAVVFALGIFPRTKTFSLDVVEEIDGARAVVIKRRACFSLIGFAIFGVAAFAAIVATVSALRVKTPPPAPSPPIKVQLIDQR